MYLIFDLDDTLLTTDKVITRYTKSVLRTCQRRGHLIVINSARPFVKIKEVCKDIEVDYIIANGGSEIYNGETLIYSNYINNKLLNTILSDIRQDPRLISFSVQSDFLYTQNMDFVDKNYFARYFDFEKKFTDNASKLIINSNDPRFAYDLGRRYDLHVTSYLNGDWYRLANTTKAEGCLALYKILGDLNPLSVAFGDDHGDLEMLQGATYGIAMKNSTAEVLASIQTVSEFSNDEDGCASHLEKLILEGVL